MEKRILIDKDTIQARIEQLGHQITEDYNGEDLTIICILKGAVHFCSDLARKIDLNTELEFMRVSSYTGEESTGKIDVKLGLDASIAGKNILIVDDVVDSGRTLSYLVEYLKLDEPKSIKICTLLDKPERRITEIEPDYVGFRIKDRFIIGYGLDLDEEYRNLESVNCFTKKTDEELKNEREEYKKQLIKQK